MTLVELAFFSVWLLGWTLGVCFLEWMVITGTVTDGMSLFLLTHGGAEVLVLGLLSRRVAGAARQHTVAPTLTRDHAGLTATWKTGTGGMGIPAGAGLLATFVHLALITTSIAAMASATTVLGWVVGLLTLPVWIFTARMWGKAVWAHVEARRTVTLEADLDRVSVTVEPMGDSVELPLAELEVTVDGDELQLRSGEVRWAGGCAPGDTRDEVVDALRTMAERAVPADPVDEPESLRRLRGHGTDTGATE